MLTEWRVPVSDAAHRVADPRGDGLAGPLGLVTEPPGATPESSCALQLRQYCLALGVQELRLSVVAMLERGRDAFVEVGDAGAILAASGLVEYGVGAHVMSGDNDVASVRREQLHRADVGARVTDQHMEVAQTLGVG